MILEEERYKYELNLKDIWQFESQNFSSDTSKMSKGFCEDVLEKMTSIYLDETKPFVENPEGKESEDPYWSEKLAQYKIGQNNDNPFYTDLIYTSWGFYTLNSNVLVKPTTENFDLWFVLKLRQFDHNLIGLPKFLEYHLRESFNSETASYSNFLTLVLRQYKEGVLSANVILTANEWIEQYALKKQTLKPGSKPKTKKVGRTISGNYDSFLFDSSNEKLMNIAANANHWSDLTYRLRGSSFIDKATKSQDLKKVFLNNEIDPKRRIVWKGSYKELQWFIKYFENNGLIETPGKDIWLIAIKCFVKVDGSEYEIGQLANANGKKLERREVLYSILNDVFGM